MGVTPAPEVRRVKRSEGEHVAGAKASQSSKWLEEFSKVLILPILIPVGLMVILFLTPLLPAVWIFTKANRYFLFKKAAKVWPQEGKFVLVVRSDSPVWSGSGKVRI